MMDHLNYGDRPMRQEDIRQLQLERLQALLNRTARNVSYYHDLFRSQNFLPEDLRDVGDLAKLPLTSRETLLERQPYGMLAVAPRDVVRLHTALGPDGRTIIVPFTRNDIRHWSELTARTLTQARVTRDDAVQICLDYGKTAAAFGMHYGAEALGATVIPRPNVVLEGQVAVMKHYRATVLVCTASYAHELGHFIERKSLDAKTLFVRSILLVGEPWNETMRKAISERLFANVYAAYGLDEVFDPGIAAEKADREGLYVNEDHFIAEVVEPNGDAVLPEGQKGELVLTTLTKEALPLIRYRTGELACLNRVTEEQSEATSLLLSLAGERIDDLIQANGAKVYPREVGETLRAELGQSIPYTIVLSSTETTDHIEVGVEVSDRAFQEEMLSLTSLKDKLESDLYLKFGITFHVRWLEQGALENVPTVQDKRR